MAKVKNPFKKQSIVDTLTNTAIGGAGNVAFDYVWDMLGATVETLGNTTKNAIKLIGGAVVGSMVSNKYLRAMADGFAVVGASDLVSGLMSEEKEQDEEQNEEKETTAGLPAGTIGRIGRRYGSPAYARRSRVRGTNGLEGFME